jgi:hypothetical protein
MKQFPELQNADGSKSKIEWKKFDGLDYLVFYGRFPTDPGVSLGIYAGGSPSFKPPRNAVTIEGKLGVFDVLWYPLESKDAKFSRTCLIDYQKATVRQGRRVNTYYTQRHVWINANTEEGLNAAIAELSKIRMFSEHPPDLVM